MVQAESIHTKAVLLAPQRFSFFVGLELLQKSSQVFLRDPGVGCDDGKRVIESTNSFEFVVLRSMRAFFLQV
jgi:hypothetical protein